MNDLETQQSKPGKGFKPFQNPFIRERLHYLKKKYNLADLVLKNTLGTSNSIYFLKSSLNFPYPKKN